MKITKKLRLFFVTTFLVLLASMALPARAAVFTVSTCDFASLTTAIGLATADGDEIALDCTGTITFTSAITIAFDITMYPINSNNVVFDGDNTYTLFNINAGKTFALSDVTLQRGRGVAGGAIYNAGTFIGTDLLINNNSAWTGGGIHNTSGATLSLSVVTMGTNTTYGGVAEQGAGIYNIGTATLNNVSLLNNTAGSEGGGIYNGTLGTMTINNSVFFGNQAISGGAINGWGTLTITNTNFTNNQAGAGGAIANFGNTSITGGIFSGNTAQGAVWAVAQFITASP